MENLQCGTVQIKYNIRHIKLYTSATNVEDISSKNMSDDEAYEFTLIYFCLDIKALEKTYY